MSTVFHAVVRKDVFTCKKDSLVTFLSEALNVICLGFRHFSLPQKLLSISYESDKSIVDELHSYLPLISKQNSLLIF